MAAEEAESAPSEVASKIGFSLNMWWKKPNQQGGHSPQAFHLRRDSGLPALIGLETVPVVRFPDQMAHHDRRTGRCPPARRVTGQTLHVNRGGYTTRWSRKRARTDSLGCRRARGSGRSTRWSSRWSSDVVTTGLFRDWVGGLHLFKTGLPE